MRISSVRTAAVIFGAGATGLVIGLVALTAGLFVSPPTEGEDPAGSTLVAAVDNEESSGLGGLSDFPVNEYGQTYGDYVMGGPKPELVSAATDDGVLGYAYLTDWVWEPAANPDEALKRQAEQINDRGEIIVPIYAVDGRTKIGTFTAGVVEFGDADRDD